MIPPLWMIAAALAVAYLLWSRPAAPAGLPPLSPLPAPLVPPAAPVAGPHPLTLLAILAAGGMIAFAIRETRIPAPQPAPAPVVGLDLRGVWHGETAAEDAAITETILSDLAWFIEDDARLAEPRLKSGQQLAELRMRARQGATHGVSLAERQPRAIDAIAAYLDREIGDKGGPLTPEDRAKWIRAFRAVSAAAGASLR